MAHDIDQGSDEAPQRRRPRYARRLWQALAVLAAALALGVALLWSQRERIADDFITQILADAGVAATYEIESIGPDVQVLRNVVIGDPAHPDATIDKVEVILAAKLGMPQVDQVIVHQARVWGRVVDGKASFGALDPLIFTDSDEPVTLPDLTLTLRDARMLIEGDYGPVALRIEGTGHLQDGFTGELAAVAPNLTLPGCSATQTTLHGTLSIADQRPQFSGPLRFARLGCDGFSVANGAAQLELRGDGDFAGLEGNAAVRTGALLASTARLGALNGDVRFSFRDAALTSTFDLTGRDARSGPVRLAVLAADGSLRARDMFRNVELQTELTGSNVQPGSDLAQILANAERSAADTLAAPLLARVRQQLGAQLPGSQLTANLTARMQDSRLAVVVPEARLRGQGGDSLLLLSRAQLSFTPAGVPLFTGNFATGGAGLPQISGRMEQQAGRPLELRLRMAEYAAGDARLEVPELALQQARDGSLTMQGQMRASGPLPGGFAQGLELPLNGTVAANGAVSLWRGCTDVRFSSLSMSGLTLQGRALTLCPPSGAPILRYDSGGLRVAAGVPSLQLAGTLGETPLRLSSGAVGFAYPGALSAREIDVVLGDPGNAMRFTVTDLAARLGDDISGTFAGTDVLLDAVPLDVRQAAGEWRFADGALALSGTSFTVEDRQESDRFKPLLAQGAVLTLANNVISSRFDLHHPGTGRMVTGVTLHHDLANASGHADIAVPGITFGDSFQPRELTELVYGVVSLVEGTVTGQGRINWTPAAITSSGTFSSDNINLAAAFGPVQGARGTVVFTDLLNLTTAPGQRIEIDSVNPGIEVTDGVVLFSLTNGTRLMLDSAEWPFLDGRLSMQPLVMNIGEAEVRRYVFNIEGLEAARFIDRMEMGNLAATGTFDGVLPVVFDEMGNGRLEGGMLSARPPGGHVSYVGQLTYEDLSYVGNFAFQALRDLNYRKMEIALDGPLTGELVTQVRLDGVSQGASAQSNFITRRIARLPIRLVVNLRAPFYQLISSMRSIYDPTMLRDPRELGLMRDNGQALQPALRGGQVPPTATQPTPDESPIQPREREAMP
jgi:hypothetical protein